MRHLSTSYYGGWAGKVPPVLQSAILTEIEDLLLLHRLGEAKDA
jgi:hypothetical protein